jgi:molybdopterin-guanine dinucleotide biosynthesis protein A
MTESMVSPADVSAVVLAGGRASRFGTSKLDADLGSRTVLDRTIEAVSRVSAEVIVVGRSMPTGSSPAGSSPAIDARFVEDRAPFEGPLAGLIEGLRRATREIVVVLGGDMPLARPALLTRMVADLAANEGIEATVLEEGGARRPLPVALRRLPALRAAQAADDSGERSLRQLLARLRVETVAESAWREIDPHAETLFDIDTPADLERARERLRG